MRGVDANGTDRTCADLHPDGATAPAPTGALVITLDWDTESDMDLHVVVPNSTDPTTPIEIWYKNRSASRLAVPARRRSIRPTIAAARPLRSTSTPTRTA